MEFDAVNSSGLEAFITPGAAVSSLLIVVGFGLCLIDFPERRTVDPRIIRGAIL